MSEETTITKKKIYTEKHILFSTFFLGPIAGLYFLYQNFITMGNQLLAKKTLRFGLIGVILFMISQFRSLLALIIYVFLPWLIMFFVVYKFQKDHIDKFLKDGGKKQNGRKVFGIALLCLLVFIIGSSIALMTLSYLGFITIQ